MFMLEYSISSRLAFHGFIFFVCILIDVFLLWQIELELLCEENRCEFHVQIQSNPSPDHNKDHNKDFFTATAVRLNVNVTMEYSV